MNATFEPLGGQNPIPEPTNHGHQNQSGFDGVVQRWIGGDKTAWEEIARMLSNRYRNFSGQGVIRPSSLGQRGWLKVQNQLLKALKANDIQRVTMFWRCAYQAIRQVVANECRKRKKRPSLVGTDRIDEVENPDKRAEMRAAIIEAADTWLNEEQRQVFDLYWLGGFYQLEVAEMLGVSDDTVGHTWREIKDTLRKKAPELKEFLSVRASMKPPLEPSVGSVKLGEPR